MFNKHFLLIKSGAFTPHIGGVIKPPNDTCEIRIDNGPEYISHVLQEWAKLHNVTLLYIQPGRPAQNAYIEWFNRTYRKEALDMYLFKNIKEVQEITDKWSYEYNHEMKYANSTNSLY